MEVSESEDDGSEVESGYVGRESLRSSEMGEQLSSRDEGEQHVDVQAVLERRVQIDNKRMSDAGHDIPFGIHMLDLSEANNIRLAQHFERKTVERSRFC